MVNLYSFRILHGLCELQNSSETTGKGRFQLIERHKKTTTLDGVGRSARSPRPRNPGSAGRVASYTTPVSLDQVSCFLAAR